MFVRLEAEIVGVTLGMMESLGGQGLMVCLEIGMF